MKFVFEAKLRAFPRLLLLASTFVQLALTGAPARAAADIDLAAAGGVGDGATLNDQALKTALAAAANGGKIHIPCGVFKIADTPRARIAAGAHVELEGSGADCSVLLISGAVDGPTFEFASPWSSVRVANLTLESDQAGGTKCLVWTGGFVNPNSAASAASVIENVTFRGSDAYGARDKYCGTGFAENSVSNVNLSNFVYQGPKKRGGTGLALSGSGKQGTYSVQINIVNSAFNDCDKGVFYGDWVQGLQMTTSNVTGCRFGVDTVKNPSGILSELAISTSQFNTFVCGVCVSAQKFDNLMLSNDMFIVEPRSLGAKVAGTNFSVVGNQFGGVTKEGATGVAVEATFGNGGVVEANAFLELDTAISVGAAAQAPLRLTHSQFVNNTNDYAVDPASSGTIIDDDQPRNVAALLATLPCSQAVKFSKAEIADAAAATFNATVSQRSGGGHNYLGVKCDGSRWYVD